MARSNLIPITKIYDIYPKYSYSKDVRRFMDDIVDIDRADVYTKDEVIAMLTEIREKAWYRHSKYEDEKDFEVDKAVEDIVNHIDAKINALKEGKDANTK